MDTKTEMVLEEVADAVGVVVVMALGAVLAWLFLAATPPQMSAECDAAQVEYENEVR